MAADMSSLFMRRPLDRVSKESAAVRIFQTRSSMRLRNRATCRSRVVMAGNRWLNQASRLFGLRSCAIPACIRCQLSPQNVLVRRA